METIYIVGRCGNQPFKITADGVSAEHAKITIRDGLWFIEDLNSKNGVFIRNAEGEFVRVYKKQIDKDTVIRLGQGGHHSCTFMANRLCAEENDFSYEFMMLKKIRKELAAEEARQEQINHRNGWIAKCSGLVVVFVCMFLGKYIDIDSNLKYLLIAFAPILTGLFFRKDSVKLKTIKARKKNLIVCPKCGKPLSGYEVDNMQCSSCKAK